MKVYHMVRCFRLSCLLSMLFAIVSCASSEGPHEAEAAQAATGSSGPWRQYVDVSQAGFDAQALLAICQRADSLQSGALMVVFRGHVILACGDVSRKFEAYSVRKSLVSGLYGTAVARGEIDLNSTIGDFEIDETVPLTAVERAATVRTVISARSGVYLPAAYGASQERGRPKRESHPPGTHWFYNNWDFNVAGVIYERATKEDLYASFDSRLAEPLGMEDWDRGDGFRAYEPTKSRHPAHTFRISARDLARFGQLYLQEGRWDAQQILPAEWVRESTRPHTDDGDGTGYGYMWWTYQAGSSFTSSRYPLLGKNTFYRGLGTGEQGLWVIPNEALVIVHRADTDHGRTVSSEDHWALVESILAARRGEPDSKPAFGALQKTPLSSQLPPVAVPEDRTVLGSDAADYIGEFKLVPGATSVGSYKMTPGGTVRVFVFDDRLYVHLPGLADVQIFPTGRDTFTARVQLGMSIVFERSTNGEVTALTLAIHDRPVRPSRAERR